MSTFKPAPPGRRVPEYTRIPPTGRPLPYEQHKDRPAGPGRKGPSIPPLRLPERRPTLCWRVSRVARELDVSRKRVYQLVDAGHLQSIRIGPRGMRILVDSVERFIDERLARNASRTSRSQERSNSKNEESGTS